MGSGTFASVRRCYHKELQNVAVKFFKFIDSTSDKNLIRNEAETLSQLKHKNVINLFGVTQWKSYVGLVMEYATNGNLENLVLKTDKNLSWPTRLRFYSEVAQGLDYLHNHDPKRAYIHGDLKLSNILLNENLTVKIADFGAVRMVEVPGTTSLSFPRCSNIPVQYSPLYVAPEFLENLDGPKTCSMDIYSYAMMGYEIITRQRVNKNSIAALGVVLNFTQNDDLRHNSSLFDNIDLSAIDQSDQDIFYCLKNTVIQCWATDPNSRPSISEVKTKLEATSATYPEDINETKHLFQNLIESSSPEVVLSQFENPFIIKIDLKEKHNNRVFIDKSVR